MTRLKLLVVDDHVLARNMIKTALRFCRCGEPEIVGEAADAATAFEMARELTPDVITMDISLPDINGLDVTRELMKENPALQVVVVTMHGEREYRLAAMEAGAAHFIDKMHLIDELPSYLDQVADEMELCAADNI